MTNQEKFIGREIAMQHWRWATPGMLFILTTAVIFVGYVGDKKISSVDNQIAGIIADDKVDRDKFWDKISDLQKQEQCTRYALESCCQGKANFMC